MNRIRRISHGVGPKSSPAISAATAKSWTTHDSNLTLLECLSTATATRPALPFELILQILEQPSRWISLHSIRHPASSDPSKPIVMVHGRPTGLPVIFTRPFSARDVRLMKEVVFTFRSRDQGWCSRPDDGDWSWFEASLACLPRTAGDGQGPFNDAVEWTESYQWAGAWMELHEKSLKSQPRYQIGTNKRGSQEPKDYTIKLTNEHELVQHLKDGHRVILWACACYPGWENRVYEAKITVLGVDDLTMDKENAA